MPSRSPAPLCLRPHRPRPSWKQEIAVRVPGVLSVTASPEEGEKKDGVNVAGETGSRRGQCTLAGPPWLGLGEGAWFRVPVGPLWVYQ